jgi:hypothetical protein
MSLFADLGQNEVCPVMRTSARFCLASCKVTRKVIRLRQERNHQCYHRERA